MTTPTHHQPVPTTRDEADLFFRCHSAKCSLMGHACAKRWRSANPTEDATPQTAMNTRTLAAHAGCIGCPAGEARFRLLKGKKTKSKPPAHLTDALTHSSPHAPSKEELLRNELEREGLKEGDSRPFDWRGVVERGEESEQGESDGGAGSGSGEVVRGGSHISIRLKRTVDARQQLKEAGVGDEFVDEIVGALEQSTGGLPGAIWANIPVKCFTTRGAATVRAGAPLPHVIPPGLKPQGDEDIIPGVKIQTTEAVAKGEVVELDTRSLSAQIPIDPPEGLNLDGSGWDEAKAERHARGPDECPDCGYILVHSDDCPSHGYTRDDPDALPGEVYAQISEDMVEASKEAEAEANALDALFTLLEAESQLEDGQRVTNLTHAQKLEICARAVMANEADRDEAESAQLAANKKIRVDIAEALLMEVNGHAPAIGEIIDRVGEVMCSHAQAPFDDSTIKGLRDTIERVAEERDALRDEVARLTEERASGADRARLDAAIDALERLTDGLGLDLPVMREERPEGETFEDSQRDYGARLAKFVRERLKAAHPVAKGIEAHRAHGVTAMLREAEEEIARLAGRVHLLEMKLKRSRQPD